MTTKVFQQIILCLVMAGAFAVRAESRSQTDSRGSLLPPPKEGLVAVRGPDLEKLEPAVGEQLQSLEKSLAALLKDHSTDDAKLSESYGLMGQVYHAYSLASPAEQCYLNAHRLAPGDFRWAYLLGNICQKEGRAEEALNYYKLARKLRPDYLAVPVNVGNIYLARNRLEEARASFQEALSLDAKCAAAQYGLGQAALSARNYAQAVEHLNQALAQVPDANRIHYALAMAYRGSGEIEKAKAHLAKQGLVGVRVPDPLVDGLQELIKGERVHLLRGRLAFGAQRFSEAADEFRKAVAAKPDSIPARVNLGSSLAQLGDLDGAIEQYNEAIKLDPQNAASHYNLGFLLAKRNEHDRAIFHLQTLLRLNAQDSQARFLLGQELLAAGRTEDALAE
ncbi:MAG: tetratricopeptide repeat protein, partial [Blastocatellia bacterium]|nr:tetratricopeptide repeat protein [Blastocatellia bacterium]